MVYFYEKIDVVFDAKKNIYRKPNKFEAKFRIVWKDKNGFRVVKETSDEGFAKRFVYQNNRFINQGRKR